MSVKFSNNAVTTLSAGISVGATSFNVSSASLFPTLASGDWTYVSLTSEVVKVTAISGTTFTCDATSAAHASGESVELRMTAELLNDFAEDTEALPKTGGAMTGAITTNSTFDGRDVATDGTKLDTIATSANLYAHPTGAGNLHVATGGSVGQVLTNTASGTGTWQDAAGGTPEGTSILSTGETGGTKYLREDGDGTCSWQAVAGGGIGSFIDTSIAISSDDTALANDDGTANDNVGIGLNCLAAVTSGAGNVAIGDGASTAGTTISGNVCVGQKAGRLHTGHGSVFIGKEAGETATSTSYSVGVGYRALEGDVTTRLTGLYNIGIGSQAGKLISSGTDNIAIGREALLSNATTITGSYNTGIGYQSGYNLSTGQYNVLSGYQAGYGLTAGSYNLCLGWQAGDSITSANYNICLGGKAGAGVVAGANNVLVGHESAKTYNFSNVTAVGFQAGELNQGSDNVFVGYKAGRSETASNKLHIANNSTESLIEGDFSAKTVNINGALTVNGAAVGGAQTSFFEAKLSATTSLAPSTWTKLPYNSEVSDPLGDYDTTLYRYTPSVAGTYFVSTLQLIQSVALGKDVYTDVRKNGVSIKGTIFYPTSGEANLYPTQNLAVVMNGTTDYLELWMRHTDTVARNAKGNAASTSSFTAFKIGD